MFTHFFPTVFFQDDPFHVIGNSHNLEFCAVPVGLSAQLFHHLDEPLVIAGNKDSASIETWFLGTGRLRPVGPVISFMEGFGLP